MNKEYILSRVSGDLEIADNPHIVRHPYSDIPTRNIIYGLVRNDVSGRFNDGEIIHTSYINKLSVVDSVVYMHTKNSIYRLDINKSQAIEMIEDLDIDINDYSV